MTSPPKSEGRLRGAALRKLRLAPNAPQFYGAQVGWFHEADRLLGEYQRTLDMRHFRALGRHLRGMRERGAAL